jgi:chromosome segregation ATPase
MSDTPETDAFMTRIRGIDGDKHWVPANTSRRLERERDDLRERYESALEERDSWRMRAEEKWAMRRELEELLGVNHAAASDEQFQKGLNRLKEIIRDRDDLRDRLNELLNRPTLV